MVIFGINGVERMVSDTTALFTTFKKEMESE
jgi:hypothetical protein